MSTYVRAVDGQLYRNPVVEGKHWFVCFDDDEPPELVVEKEHQRPGLSWFKMGTWNKNHPKHGHRCFGGNIHDTRAALAYFGKLAARIPVPKRHDGVAKADEIGQGVIYDPLPKAKKKRKA